jgi:hypothetical protein
MKKINLIFILLIVFNSLFGQIVESSCEAPDSIVEKYQDDADVLTLRKFYDNDMTWADSIEIPDAHSDTILNALLAVWNAEDLAARDTVVEMSNIHAAINFSVNRFRIKCDTSVDWVHQLENGNFPTGNNTVDSLMTRYPLSIENIINHLYFFFISDINYNMPVLANIFDSIDGVINTHTPSGDYPGVYNKDIISNIGSEYVYLTFSFGWNDCLSGCLDWRHWDFKVYYDCSVEFVDSYGSIVPYWGITKQHNYRLVEVYPNPCYGHVYIRGVENINMPFEYSLINTSGVKIFTGETKTERIDFGDQINTGMYILELYTKEKTIRRKIQIIKN